MRKILFLFILLLSSFTTLFGAKIQKKLKSNAPLEVTFHLDLNAIKNFDDKIYFSLEVKKNNGKTDYTPGLIKGKYDLSKFEIRSEFFKIHSYGYLIPDYAKILANKGNTTIHVYSKLNKDLKKIEEIKFSTVKEIQLLYDPNHVLSYDAPLHVQLKIKMESDIVFNITNKPFFNKLIKLETNAVHFDGQKINLNSFVGADNAIILFNYILDENIKDFVQVKVVYSLNLDLDLSGSDGMSGRNGSHGSRGVSGQDGQDGMHGGHGKNVTIYARLFEPSTRFIEITIETGRDKMVRVVDRNLPYKLYFNLSGGNGGNGGNGGDGGDGIDGTETSSPGYGGDGGHGGDAGNGGNGGYIQIFAHQGCLDFATHVTMVSNAGIAGYPGKSGRGGRGGVKHNAGILNVLITGRAGSAGRNGESGINGNSGYIVNKVMVE